MPGIEPGTLIVINKTLFCKLKTCYKETGYMITLNNIVYLIHITFSATLSPEKKIATAMAVNIYSNEASLDKSY